MLPGMRCDACRDDAVWVAVIPRVTKTKKQIEPGRMRLCDWHAGRLCDNDENVHVFPLVPLEHP